MEKLEMNGTELNEDSLLKIDGGVSWNSALNFVNKGLDLGIVGVGSALAFVTDGATLVDPDMDAAILGAGVDLFS